MTMRKTLDLRLTYFIGALLAAIAGVTSASLPARAATGDHVTLTSVATIGREVVGPDGQKHLVWKDPKQVVVIPGDKVHFVIHYENQGSTPVASFAATNPLPAAILYTGVDQDWAELSVDGGKTWGKLDTLKVDVVDAASGAHNPRAAEPADVTTIRWVFAQPIPAHGSGDLGYSGIVR